jgi:peptidyl-prolyl cis-trans isomerase C
MSAGTACLALAAILATWTVTPGVTYAEQADKPAGEAQAEQSQADKSKVVAKVNGTDITEFDLQLAETEIGSDLGNIPPESRRRVLVEYLIENQLFAQAASEKKIENTDSFDKRMEYMRRRALREEFFEQQIATSVSEKVALSYYNDQIKGMKPQEEVKARHILVETEEKARDILEKIRRGEDFAKMAMQNSVDPGTKGKGGLLGFFTKGQMVPQFEQAAFGIDVGEVSDPVQSRFGWHLIKVEEKRERPLPKFEEVKDQILNSMILQRAQAQAAELRKEAKVEYLDAEIKKQVAEQEKQAAAQRQQMIEQIKKMAAEQEEKKKEAAGGDAEKADK